MIVFRRAAVLACTFIAVAALEGCRKKPQPTTTPTPAGPNADSIAMARAREDSIVRERARADSIARARADSIRNAEASSAAAASELERMRTALGATIYFEFDMSELRDDSRSLLDSKIPVLAANPDIMMRIDGHTDDRGSDEYNLALGQRRAAAAKRYLTDRGISESRIETRSMGEERPVCQEGDESCWSRNRRAEFQITSGGTNLRRP